MHVNGVYQSRVNPIEEAERIVERAIVIMTNEMDRSLAIVAMNGSQRDL